MDSIWGKALKSLWVLAIGVIAWVSGAVQSSESGPEVRIDHAWVRAMPPGQRNTAAYLAVTNRGSSPLEIVGATTDLANRAEIHVSREVDGYVRMEQLHSLALPPGQTVQLSPGGKHLMLLGLKEMPVPGSTARLCLSFADGQSACVDAPVQKSPAGSANHHQHHQ